MPAFSRLRRTGGEALEGPIVQTIRVRRITGSPRVPVHATAHLVLSVNDPALELAGVDHGASHSANQVALRAIRRGHGDDVSRFGGAIGDSLDNVVGRMAFA